MVAEIVSTGNIFLASEMGIVPNGNYLPSCCGQGIVSTGNNLPSSWGRGIVARGNIAAPPGTMMVAEIVSMESIFFACEMVIVARGNIAASRGQRWWRKYFPVEIIFLVTEMGIVSNGNHFPKRLGAGHCCPRKQCGFTGYDDCGRNSFQ